MEDVALSPNLSRVAEPAFRGESELEKSFNRYFAWSGLLLIGIAAAGLVSLLVVFLRLYDKPVEMVRGGSILEVLLSIAQQYSDSIIIFVASAFFAMTGMKLLGVAGASTRSVIPRRDYDVLADAIRAPNQDAITQYIRLSALTGVTGFFTKLGLSGLPFATIGLTLVFSAISMARPEFLDLAKLTLGAFIGSFVQRGIAGKPDEPAAPPKPAE